MDSRIWPGRTVSVVRIDSEEGGMDPDSVADTVRRDSDGLDGVVFAGDGTDLLAIPGVHRIISKVRPRGLTSVMITDGRRPDIADDLIGAGLADRVILTLDGVPDADQNECIRAILENGAGFDVRIVLDRRIIDADTVVRIAAGTEGHGMFVMALPDDPEGRPPRKEVDALLGRLSGRARNPRVLRPRNLDRSSPTTGLRPLLLSLT